MLIILYQVVLGDRFARIQEEAARIVGYVYEGRLARGEFPADLSGYAYRDPATRPDIRSYRRDEAAGGGVLG